MKQTKKVSRQQRNFLLKAGVENVRTVRVIQDTKEYIDILHDDGTIERISKEVFT